MTRAIVAGCIGNRYLYGGGAWVRRSWFEGLRRLGFDALFVEHILPEKCVDEEGKQVSFQECVNRRYFNAVMEEFGMKEVSVLIYGNGEETDGATLETVMDFAEESELLVNITGNLQLDAIKCRIKHRVYLDVDPGWTQVAAAKGDLGPRLGGHNRYFTIGENIGSPACRVDTGDVRWGTVRQPLVLDDWPMSENGERTRLTTIATLKGPGPFPRARIGSRMYGLKGDELKAFLDLPSLAPQEFEIAIRRTAHWKEQVAPLAAHGWRVIDAAAVSTYPRLFRKYVQLSGGEFSTARGIYVHTWSGWFSDRTTRYLASGKPALVQDTGFSRRIPVGEGLVAFRTLAEAAAGAGRIASDYDSHSRAARAVASEYFDSDVVLTEFVSDVGVSP